MTKSIPYDNGAPERSAPTAPITRGPVGLARRLGARLLHEIRKALPPSIFFFVGFNFVVLTSNLLVARYMIGLSNFMLAVLVDRTALDRHVVPQRGDGLLQPRRAIDDHQLGRCQAPGYEVIQEGAPGSLAFAAHVAQGEQHLLAVAPNAQRHQHGQAGCLLERRTRTTVPSRTRRTMSSCDRSRFCHASQSVCTLCQARLTASLPMAPPNSAPSARRTRRVLVPARYALAISTSARLVSRL